MNHQAFDIASSFLSRKQDDATALRGVGNVAQDDTGDFEFASQLHALRQTGEGSSKDFLTSLFLKPEGDQPINDLPHAYENPDVSMPLQTISTSTWQAWLEQQVSDAGSETYPKQQKAAIETNMDQARGATEDNLSKLPSPPIFLAEAQWAQTQSATLREEPVAQDSSSTRASASADTTAHMADTEQQQLFANTNIKTQLDAVSPGGSDHAPAGGRTTSNDSLATGFAERAAAILLTNEGLTAAPVSSNVDVENARDDAQMPLWAISDALASDKESDTFSQVLQADWHLGAQARLAQALPAQASASATLEVTFADKLSDFAMLAPHGDIGSDAFVSSGRATELTPSSPQENVDVLAEMSGGAAPAKAQPKQSEALFSMLDDSDCEITDADAKTTSYGVHEGATADVRTDLFDEHMRLKEAEDPVLVDWYADADAQRGAIAAQLTAGPSVMASQSASTPVDTANTPQKVSQGLEAYNSLARQTRPDTDESSGSADAARATQGPGDATGKVALKAKPAVGFSTNLAQASDAEPQSPTAASPHEAATTAASRAQSSDNLIPSASKVISPSAAESAQAAAMTATVTPSRLSAQLAANLSDGARRIQLRVAPPGLGTLDIGVHLQGAQVHLIVRGDQPELTRFMQEGMGDLQKHLQQHGLDLGTTDFRGEEGSAEADGESPRSDRSQNSKVAPPQARASNSATRIRDAHVINVLL